MRVKHLNERESSPLPISTLHSTVSYRSYFLKCLYLLLSSGFSLLVCCLVVAQLMPSRVDQLPPVPYIWCLFNTPQNKLCLFNSSIILSTWIEFAVHSGFCFLFCVVPTYRGGRRWKRYYSDTGICGLDEILWRRSDTEMTIWNQS